uniref:Uncharacterized protein n=1 Tax=Arundo donax TaxID=35708 RepID=A0A0A8Y1S7_ARUDO
MFLSATSLNLLTGQQFSIGSTNLLMQLHITFCTNDCG